jgi:hypothetical protein
VHVITVASDATFACFLTNIVAILIRLASTNVMAESTTLLTAAESWDLGARGTSWMSGTSEATTSWGTISTIATAIAEAMTNWSLTTKSTRADTLLRARSVVLVEVLEALSSRQSLLVSVSVVAIDSVISVELMSSSSYWSMAQDLVLIMS